MFYALWAPFFFYMSVCILFITTKISKTSTNSVSHLHMALSLCDYSCLKDIVSKSVKRHEWWSVDQLNKTVDDPLNKPTIYILMCLYSSSWIFCYMYNNSLYTKNFTKSMWNKLRNISRIVVLKKKQTNLWHWFIYFTSPYCFYVNMNVIN